MTGGFRPSTVDLANIRPGKASDTLWLQNLRDGEVRALVLRPQTTSGAEKWPEDYIVRHLIDFHDIDYAAQADLLYGLAGQVVRHLQSYLPEEETEPVLRQQGEALAVLAHGQMQAHYAEAADEGYEATVHRGWTALKPSAYTAVEGEPPLDFRQKPADLGKIATCLFGGFRRCLYPVQKFHSNPERVLAVILDRDTLRWFRPVNGQFHPLPARGRSPRIHPRFRRRDRRPDSDAGTEIDQGAERSRGADQGRRGTGVVPARERPHPAARRQGVGLRASSARHYQRRDVDRRTSPQCPCSIANRCGGLT